MKKVKVRERREDRNALSKKQSFLLVPASARFLREKHSANVFV